MLLNLAHNLDAMDTVGISYLRQAVDMARRIGLFSAANRPSQDSRSSRARAFTAWALYNFQT